MAELIDETQTAKRKNWPVIIVISITVLSIIVALGAKSGISYFKAVQRQKLPYYSLEVQGDQLVFRTFQNGKPEILKTVATLPKSEITATQKDQTLTIKIGEKSIDHPADWRDGFVISPKNHAVFFKQTILIPSAKTGQGFTAKYILYHWNESRGFKKLTAAMSHFMSTKLSLDESTLVVNFYDEKSSFGTLVYTIATGKVDMVANPIFQESAVMIDPDNLILGLPGNTREGKYIVVYRGYNLSSKSYRDFYVDQTVQEIVAFNGSIWCRAESPGKQSILRLNKKFDKVEERIDFPAINP